MKDEYEELAEELVAVVDKARHNLNVAFASGKPSHAAALLEFCYNLQYAVDVAEKRMPSQFRVEMD